jgi:dATP pyrophosphohydrolase
MKIQPGISTGASTEPPAEVATGSLRRPESVLVVVYTANAEVLLLKRREPFAFWQSITGSLQLCEDHASAAARELFEETGLRGELLDAGACREFAIDPRWLHKYPAGVLTNREHEWRLLLPARQDIVICDREHSDFQWVPVDEAIEFVWSWTNKEALESLRKELR